MKKSARFSIRNILASIVIVAFGLGVGYLIFQSYVPVELRQGNVLGASTFSMPKIGADTLADPEYYTPALAGIGSEDEIRLQDAIGEPSRTETPPGPVYGFGLKADSKEDLNEISFIVHKQDGNVVGPYLVEVAEDLVDREGQPISGAFTDPYLFAAGVAKIDFFNTDNKEFTIKYIEFIGQGDEDQVNTQTVVSDANRLYKERFMQEAGLNIVTRDEYGAADDNIFAPGWTPPYYAVNRIVVHHTATGVDMGNPANTVAAIWRYHTYDLDWGDLGYNFLIDPYGNIYEGRAGINGVRGNHAPPNEGSIGISLLGDFTNQLPTQAALDSLVRLTAYLAKVNQINLVYKTSYDSANPEGMYGHRAINATACPGNTFFLVLPQIRDAAASLMAQQGEIDVKINKVNSMVDDREYYQTDTATQILIKLDGLPDLLKEKLKNPPPRFALKLEQDDSLIYEIPKDMLKQSLTELKVVAPEAVSQPNYKYELQTWSEDAVNERSVPSDYNVSQHWYLEQIQAPEAWYYLNNNTDPASHTGSSGVKVAVIDTGVAYEDFNFNAGSVYDRQYYKSPDLDNATFTDPYDAAFDYLCQYRSLTLDSCSAGEWAKVDHANDDQGHGTFVSSVIGATISDATPDILLGIAPSVKIIPIKVSLPVDSALGLDSGAIYTNFLEMAIDHARVSGANVINISLGAESSEDPYLLDAINDAYDAGITIVASSGNHTLPGDAEYVLFPANLDNVIAVGASNYAGDARATYSNYGPELDVVAPVGSGTGDGGVIASTLSCFTSDCTESSDLSLFPANGSYIRGWGTSFAAPQVAAQVALIKSIYTSEDNADLFDRIKFYLVDIAPTGFDQNTGYGKIQLYTSIANTEQPSIISINPTSIPSNGGSSVTITGTNLQNGAIVSINSINAAVSEYNEPTSITVIAPSGIEGPATVRVTNPNNYWDEISDGLSYSEAAYDNFDVSTLFSSSEWDVTKMKNLVSGDFNRDGLTDIATMYDYGDNTIGLWVFVNSYSGFMPQMWMKTQGWNVANSPKLTSGDFNNDGWLDLATMYNYGSSTMGLWVFPNLQNNTFSLQRWFLTSGWDASRSPNLTSGDFNRDGRIDLASMYNYSSSTMGIWVFPNLGSSFTWQRWLLTGGWDASRSPELISADFNNDSRTDLATMYNYGGSTIGIWTFPNMGSSFNIQMWFITSGWDMTKSNNMTVADFNRDSRTDIGVMYNYGGNTMGTWTFLNLGSSFIWQRWLITGGWDASKSTQLASGDFNFDGNQDFVTLYNYGSPTFGIWTFNTNGYYVTQLSKSFEASGFETTKMSNMTSEDFNNDGRTDFAVLYDLGSAKMGVWTFMNNGYGAYYPQMRYRTSGWEVSKSVKIAAADFNRDNRKDLSIMYNYGGNVMGILIIPGSVNSFGGAQRWLLTGGWDTANSPSLVSGDINGDGHPDLATMYNYSNTAMGIWVFNGNGTNGFGIRRWLYTTGWDARNSPDLLIGNFNGDGFFDFATLYKYSDTNSGIWTFGTNGNVINSLVKIADLNGWDNSLASNIISGNYNLGGTLDIASIYEYSANEIGTNVIFGTYPSYSRQRWSINSPWVSSGVISINNGDINYDGKIDLAILQKESENSISLSGLINSY